MERSEKLERINLALQKLIENQQNSNESSTGSFVDLDDNDHLLLSRLLSQLDTVKGEDLNKESEASSPLVEIIDAEVKKENDNVGGGTDEIVKELKKVKKQNFVTHCLLTVMIIITLGWQLSEVSLILKVKQGLNHPFRSLWSLFVGKLKEPDQENGHGEDMHSADAKHLIETPSLGSFKMPEMPHMDIPDLGLNGAK